MKRKKNNKILILVLVFFISIGFAYLSSNLSINGNIGYSKNSWDIYFDNIVVNENSIEADVPVIENKTTINFSCLFNQPGSFYEFTVDIVNKGTIDAMIDEITKSTLSEEYANYLEYDVTYLDGTEISKYDSLPSGARLKLKVKVQYKYDIAEIPNLEEISLSTSLTYLLADENALFGHGEYWDFDYTGEVETFNVPHTGTYKLEVWASEGKVAYAGKAGYGGYASGEVTLNKNTELYLAIGGKESFNGGGVTTVSRGGDATHIAYKNNRGTLANYENNIDEILIVAGGGGGAENIGATGFAGHGGGYIGNDGHPVAGTAGGSSIGKGGTQQIGGLGSNLKSEQHPPVHNLNGSFGTGGNGTSYNDSGPGGGGGLYGGGASTYAGAAGGGSGYIGNEVLKNKVMYCYQCAESIEEATRTISTTNVSEDAISNYAKKGTGHIRITMID